MLNGCLLKIISYSYKTKKRVNVHPCTDMDSDYGYEQFKRDAVALRRFATKISQYDGLRRFDQWRWDTPDYFRLCTVIDELAHKFLIGFCSDHQMEVYSPKDQTIVVFNTMGKDRRDVFPCLKRSYWILNKKPP